MQFLTQFLGNFNWKIALAVIVGIIAFYIGYNMFNNHKESIVSMRQSGEQSKMAIMMLFYADWCPHCNTAKPEWEKIKTEYEGQNINGYTVHFEEHNCSSDTDEKVIQLMDKYNIEGFPTIKLLKDNEIIEYDAKPTKETMEQFLQTVL